MNSQSIKNKLNTLQGIYARFEGSSFGRILIRLLSLWYTRCLIAIVWLLLIFAVSIPISKTLPQSLNSTNKSNQSLACKNGRIHLPEYSDTKDDTYLYISQNDNNSISVNILTNSTNYTYTYNICKVDSEYSNTIEINVFKDISDNYLSLVTLALLVAFSAVLGYVSSLLFLPPLFGMVIAGIIFTHIPQGNFPATIPRSVIHTCRTIAIVILLGGFSLRLSIKILKLRFFQVIGLAFIPSSVETALVSILTRLILQVDWQWACMSGVIVAVVSPTIVVPLLLRLKKQGYGKVNGISDILISASYYQIIFTVSILCTFRTFAISTSDLVLTIFRVPVELVIGLLYGIIFGLLGGLVGWGRKKHSRTRNRSIYFIGVTSLSLFGSSKVFVLGSDMLGAGITGFVITSIVCSLVWGSEKKYLAEIHKYIGYIIEPLLFGLIGYELNLTINPISAVTLIEIIGIILLGLASRSVVAFLISFCFPKLKLKERFFVPMVWVSKATLQAIAGSIALDSANTPELIEYGRIVLYFAIFSILLTSPLGFILTSFFGTRLLSQELHTPLHEEDDITSAISLSKFEGMSEESEHTRNTIPTNCIVSNHYADLHRRKSLQDMDISSMKHTENNIEATSIHSQLSNLPLTTSYSAPDLTKDK
ncbi:hypothetical protein LOD99_7063 [Oopsacas minuta]|uniref:Cation/H+ exchanger domain-containing protein n=1 Tax=Oopsacas minuta TaxID=111878 RepID=A0AAV7JJ45_9METZ|nr:hypothetical protein LOD99_7063 [Oopsacas minuta]